MHTTRKRKFNAATRADARLAFLHMLKAGTSIAESGRRIGVSNVTAWRWSQLAKTGHLLAEDASRLRLTRDEALRILSKDARDCEAPADRRASIELLAKLGEVGGLAPTRQQVDQRVVYAEVDDWIAAQARIEAARAAASLEPASDKALPQGPISTIMSTAQVADKQEVASIAVDIGAVCPPVAPQTDAGESGEFPAENFPKIAAEAVK